MSKSCARCEKTVYPIEELKCLDKVRITSITYKIIALNLLINNHDNLTKKKLIKFEK